MRWKLYIDDRGRDEWRAETNGVTLRVKRAYGRMACGPLSAWCAIISYPDVGDRLVGTYASATTAKLNASRALLLRLDAAEAGGRVQRTVGRWRLSWSQRHPDSVFVDFEGEGYRRSQSGLLYDSGEIGWDYPELVPASIASAVRALFDGLGAAGLTRVDPNAWLLADET